jgi:iron complex outermembrane receptor protein
VNFFGNSLRIGLAIAAWLALSVPVTAQNDAVATDGDGGATTASGGGSGLDLNMNLDQLTRQDVVVPGLSTPVTTVERQTSTVGRTPAAVFVITPEMIKRSGARTLPDVLRMAPGVDVARIAADIWAISIRGFNDRFANKLLVQIDGRIVYTATSGGVYWNQQDVVLADVERIEVIRGPGTTMWGSNAVNGVINIITKNSKDTQGALVQSGGGGELLQDFNTVRYGGGNGNGLTWRVFGQQTDYAGAWCPVDLPDPWRMKHAGFRMDYTPTCEDTFTLQGDIYQGHAIDNVLRSMPAPPFAAFVSEPYDFPGGNILFRYGKKFDDDTSWQLQTYYDHYQTIMAELPEKRDQYDIDLQYQFPVGEYHQFISGVEYRNSPSIAQNNFTVSLFPPELDIQWASVYAQDTITLEEDRWYLTLGCRLEYNTLGKFQPEPTARILMLPSERQSLWAAISRAARNPAQLDVSMDARAPLEPGVPAFINFLGDPNFQAENLVAYEVGYRAAPTDFFSWDIAGYVNDYGKVRGFVATPPVVDPPYVFLPLHLANNIRATSYGFETTATLQMNECWRLLGSYSLFEVNVRGDPIGALQIEGSSPHNMIYLRSAHDIGRNVQFDAIGRYVDALTALDVPSYFEMDVRLGWQATEQIEVSFVGQNLLQGHHLEFVDAISSRPPTQVQRSWYGMVSWVF